MERQKLYEKGLENYPKAKEKSGNYELGMKMAGLTWGLLIVVPIIAIPVTMFLHREFLVPGGMSLAGFLAMMVVNQFGRKKGCAQCKMRYVCEASAAE